MKTAQDINESFRKQIRNRQKQQIFQSIRSKFEIQPIQKNDMSHMDLSSSLYSNSQMSLRNLVQQIKQDQGVKLCNKLIDSGMHHELINNLRSNINVHETFQVISTIISKQKIKVANKFVRLGLIDEILRHTQQINESIDLCMNILANIIFQNVQYAEMMLQNNVHRHLFNLATKVIYENEKLDKKSQDTGFYIMWALAALLEVENTADYKQKFIQILKFGLHVHTKQLYPRIILQIIFLVGYSFRQQTQSLAASTLNDMIKQIDSTYSLIQTLLIVIKLLTPFQIDYSKISTIIVTTSSNKAISYGIRILEKIVPNSVQRIPRTIQWWQRLYLRIVRHEDIELYVSMLRKCNIKSEWVYPMIDEIIQKYSVYVTVINQVLMLINSLLERVQSPEEGKKVRFYIKSSNIYSRLEKLYDSKNVQISRKCQYLLISLNFNNIQ